MKKFFALTCIALTFCFAVSANANITLINNYTSFLSYCPSPLVENFEDTTLVPGLTITEVGTPGSIHDGIYENIVRGANQYQVFNYNSLLGFGAWLDLTNPGGPGSELDMYADGTFVRTVPNTAAGEFYGFYSDVPVLQVAFMDHLNPYGWQETYYSIDLALGTNPVPLPAAVWLLGAGLMGLVGIRRKVRS
jgi:hypothetical protein